VAPTEVASESRVTTPSVARLSLRAVFAACRYKPHTAQRKFHQSGKRFRIFAGGRRDGKSQAGGMEIVPSALISKTMAPMLLDDGKRWEEWIVGPEYSDAEKEFRVVYNALKRLQVPFDKPGTYNNPHTGDMQISLWGGAFLLQAMSAKYPDSLVGEGLRRVTLSEAAKIKERVWDKFIRPTLSDFGGEAVLGSTPEGKNWFYRMWQKGQDPNDIEHWSIRSPAWDNPYVYPRGATKAGIATLQKLKATGDPVTKEIAEALDVDWEICSLLLGQTAESFAQEIGADFTEYVGRVFKEWDEETHVRDLSYNPGWKTYAAHDNGFTNPMVWLVIQVGPFGEVHVLEEYYERERTIPEAALEIEGRGLRPEGMLGLFPDPASPGDNRDLSNRLRVPLFGKTGGEIKDRLALIRDALVPRPAHLPADHPDKRPRLLVNRRCKHTIREMQDYRYPRTAEEAQSKGQEAPENPLKKDDHCPEALGRFFAGYTALMGEGPKTTRQSRSKMNRRRR
jgi:hypothetical protein